MKKLLLIMLLLLMAMPCFSQWSYFVSYSGALTFDLVDTEYDIVYVLVPDTKYANWYISETQPTGLYLNGSPRDLNFVYDGNITLCTEADTSTGMVDAESDSTSLVLIPLVYNPVSSTWELSMNDSTFLVLGTRDTYTATSIDYMDWDSGKTYTCTLSGELLPTGAFAIAFHQKNDDSGTSSRHLWFSLTRQWR